MLLRVKNFKSYWTISQIQYKNTIVICVWECESGRVGECESVRVWVGEFAFYNDSVTTNETFLTNVLKETLDIWNKE